MKQLLDNDTLFAGHRVLRRLSARHGGEREVYAANVSPAESAAGEETAEYDAVLTVFNLKSKRYSADDVDSSRVPDSIEEVRFLRSIKDSEVFLPVIDCGVEKAGDTPLVWMLQKRVEGDTLSAEIHQRSGLTMEDAVKVMEALFDAVDDIARNTGGGGHYNITADNILLRYDGDTLLGVHLIGLSEIGAACQGSTPFEGDGSDHRFRAPESYRGIYSHLSDIYSLGVILTMMITGDMGEDVSDFADSSEFRKKYMRGLRERLSAAQRLILDKATDVNPAGRFQTVDKFRTFVGKLSKGQLPERRHVERAKPAVEETPAETTFPFPVPESHGLDDVGGMDEIKDIFRRDFVRIIRNPNIAKAYGITPSNCVILYGPQGCGKTFIARKAAEESGLKYKVIYPADLGSTYIHGSQEKIAETFKEAEKNAPMILIFDEFDAIAPKRDIERNPHQANEVNELLTRLNNCAERGVYVLATTNRPHMIDTAVLRSGRTDRLIYVSLPDFKARQEIFKLELKKCPCADDIDLDALAKATENFSCSDLSYVMKECSRRCFDETVESGVKDLIPLSQTKILDVIKSTRCSVSEDERRSYLALREKMEQGNSSASRPPVGFAL